MNKWIVGDPVQVKAQYDIPPMFRDNKPTRGIVDQVYDDGTVWVNVPIGDDDPNEHSQAVPYQEDQLEAP